MAADPILQGKLVNVSVMMTDHYSYAENYSITVGVPADPATDWYWYGQLCADGHRGDPPDARYLMIRPHPDYMGEPLAQPLYYRRLWGISERDGNYNAKFALWTAEPPPGFTVIGDIFNRNQEPQKGGALMNRYVCVDNACVLGADIGAQLWDDHGTMAADQEASMWEIAGTGDVWKLFTARSDYNRPSGARRLNPDLIEML